VKESGNDNKKGNVPPRRRWQLNPLARKRWNRFQKHRRGFWSLILLVAFYAISLFSEFISNDHPLYVRYRGESYFPVIKFYPDDVFTGSGRQTRPDYKKIQSSEMFKRDASNVMLFPPVPFGPNEIINPEDLRGEEQVALTLRAVPRVGSVNIDQELKVVRSQSAESFLVGLQEGNSLASIWMFRPDVQAAIADRLANRASPSFRTVMTNVQDSSMVVDVSIPEYSVRKAAPRDVRLTFREIDSLVKAERTFKFGRDENRTAPDDPIWQAMTDDQRNSLLQLIDRRFTELVTSPALTINGQEYAVQLKLNDVQWPFRPVPGHWFGIDNAGRDVFSRILYGLRTSMTFGLLLVLFSMGFGVIMGAIQGYYGGRVDLVAQRVIEIWSTIPFLYVMILLGSMYGRSFSLLLFCYAIFNWIGISYYVRAEFFRLRHTPFVDAARCLGLSSSRIMFRHILPNALTPIITFFPFSLVGAIGSLAVLDFLGFGLPPPTPSWGEMLQQAQSFRWAWWLILYPSLALFVVMLLGVFMGEGVRDAYDPKPVMKME